MREQRCTQCEEWKELISKNFAPRHASATGLDTKCRKCVNLNRKKLRDNKKHETDVKGYIRREEDRPKKKYRFNYEGFLGDKEVSGYVMAQKEKSAKRCVRCLHPGITCISITRGEITYHGRSQF